LTTRTGAVIIATKPENLEKNSPNRALKTHPMTYSQLSRENAREEKAKFTILLITCLAFSVAVAYLLSRQPMIRIRSDHYSRWYATYMLVTEHRSLYDPQNGQEIVALNTIPFDPIEGSFFYPAYLILFTLPLVWIPYFWAHFIWLILIQLFLVLGIWIVFREAQQPISVYLFTIFLFLSMLFIPNLQNTIWGQFNTIAVLGLALVYRFFIKHRYFLAGLLATGLMFKPQEMLLTLGFLVFWAVHKKERRAFIVGFGAGMFILWLLATIFEPDWVHRFIAGVRSYAGYLTPQPVIQLHGNLAWFFWLIVGLFIIWIFFGNRSASPESTTFAGLLVLSLGAWWLMVPVLGMMHLVAFPIALLLLWINFKRALPHFSGFVVWTFLILYVLGLIGFVYGLVSPDSYGIHILLAELAYKQIAVILLVLLTLPFCIPRKVQVQ
jgi:hypothetical protein